jgi:hypothetical protein
MVDVLLSWLLVAAVRFFYDSPVFSSDGWLAD